MAYANTGGTVTVWPLPGNSAQPLDIPIQASALAYSPDGTMLAAGAADFSVQLWDAATGAFVRGTVPDPNDRDQSPIEFVAFSPDQQYLATNSEAYNAVGATNNKIRVWRVADGAQVFSAPSNEEGPVTFSPDGRLLFGYQDTLATGQVYGLAVWNVPDFTSAKILQANSTSTPRTNIVFRGDGTLIGSDMYGIGAIRTDDWTALGDFPGLPSVDKLALSADGKLLAADTESDTVVRLWCFP